MKKNKKKTENIRYNGRNAFGERCIAKFLVLEKETAMQQFLEALADIDAHKGKRIEYTFQLGKTFTHEEADAFRLQSQLFEHGHRADPISVSIVPRPLFH